MTVGLWDGWVGFWHQWWSPPLAVWIWAEPAHEEQENTQDPHCDDIPGTASNPPSGERRKKRGRRDSREHLRDVEQAGFPDHSGLCGPCQRIPVRGGPQSRLRRFFPWDFQQGMHSCGHAWDEAAKRRRRLHRLLSRGADPTQLARFLRTRGPPDTCPAS